MDQENNIDQQPEAVGDNVIMSGDDQNMDEEQIAGDALDQSQGNDNIQDEDIAQH